MEVQRWEEFKELRAEVHVEKKEEALKTAREWSDQGNTVWTDGPRLEDGSVGAAVAYWKEGSWERRGSYLGKNKEVFDAELFAIRQALEILNDRDERGMHYTIFSDSQAALCRVQHDRTGPGQMQAVAAITLGEAIAGRDNSIALRWTPSHAGAEENELADIMAKGAAEGRGERASAEYLREASLSHLTRTTTETKSRTTAEWIPMRSGRHEDTVLRRVGR